MEAAEEEFRLTILQDRIGGFPDNSKEYMDSFNARFGAIIARNAPFVLQGPGLALDQEITTLHEIMITNHNGAVAATQKMEKIHEDLAKTYEIIAKKGEGWREQLYKNQLEKGQELLRTLKTYSYHLTVLLHASKIMDLIISNYLQFISYSTPQPMI